MAAFDWRIRVRFRHCDPAGIVFYPRYFEMANDVVESFFDEGIGWAFHRMHGPDRLGVPMGRISARFTNPSRVGDVLDWRLAVTRVGTASASLALAAACAGQPRLTVEGTIVLIDLDAMKSRPWPDAIRAKLSAYDEEQAS